MAVAPPDRALCTQALDRLLSSSDGISAAMLALRDGRPFVERCAGSVDSGKFALAGAEQPIVDEDARKLLADRLVQQGCGYG